MLAPSTKFSAASITVKLVIDDGGWPNTQELKLVLKKEHARLYEIDTKDILQFSFSFRYQKHR